MRQLENEIKRLAVMIRGDVITPGDLDASIKSTTESPSSSLDLGPNVKASLEKIEQQLIEIPCNSTSTIKGRPPKPSAIKISSRK